LSRYKKLLVHERAAIPFIADEASAPPLAEGSFEFLTPYGVTFASDNHRNQESDDHILPAPWAIPICFCDIFSAD
jgi:hypothetical protein